MKKVYKDILIDIRIKECFTKAIAKDIFQRSTGIEKPMDRLRTQTKSSNLGRLELRQKNRNRIGFWKKFRLL